MSHESTLDVNPFFEPHVPQAPVNVRNIYFDADMAKLRTLFTDLRNVFKTIEKRWLRHDTVQIATSVFNYCETKRLSKTMPYLMYDFRLADTRICVVRFSKDYYVSVVGWTPPPYRFKDYVTKRGYGPFPDIQEAIRCFADMVRVFSSDIMNVLAF